MGDLEDQGNSNYLQVMIKNIPINITAVEMTSDLVI